MGYELWVSPNTGIRRKGTTFKELQSIFVDNITTKFIYESIYSCRLNDECSFVKEELTFRDFDIVGVINSDSRVIGYVNRIELAEGLIEPHLKVIELQHLISDSTPISALLRILTQNPFTFVLVQEVIEGIVTRADINKPIVRIYLFGIISLFELHLNFWINKYYKNESWKEFIKEERMRAAKKIFDDRKGNNEELSLLECLQFCDKREILMAATEFLEGFNFSKNEFASLLRHIEKIRNELAHSQNSIISNLGWNEFYRTIFTAENFLHASEKTVGEKVKSPIK